MERTKMNAIAERMRNELLKVHECLTSRKIKPGETLVYGPDGCLQVMKISDTFPLPRPCMQ